MNPAEALQRASAAYGRGRWDEARQLCRAVLERCGPEFNALSLLGAIASHTGQAQEAAQLLGHAAAVRPDVAAAHNNHGIALKNIGLRDQALDAFRKALRRQAAFPEALYNQGNVLRELGRCREAVASYDAALAIQPRYYEAHIGKGIALYALNEKAAALACCDQALSLDPRRAEAHNNRAIVLEGLGRQDEALESYDRAITIDPDYIEALDGRGVLLRRLARPECSLADHEKVTRLRPGYAGGHLNRGAALAALGRHAEALQSCERALALPGDHGAAYLNRGHGLAALGRCEEALGSYEASLTFRQTAEARLGRSQMLLALSRSADALEELEHLIALDADHAEAHNLRGHALRLQQRFEEAASSYGRALALAPTIAGLRGLWLHTRMSLCDWHDYERQVAELAARLEAGEAASPPFPVLSLIDSPRLQRQAAELRIRHDTPTVAGAPKPTRPSPTATSAATAVASASTPASPAASAALASERPARISIGYFSADLHDHATAHLIAELIERHDRSRFEISAFSFGPVQRDPMRQRLEASFDRFLEVGARADAEIAALAREIGIDIAVDLKGFTGDERHEIFAHRAAPVQVSYLGYPGTLGADYIDYLIADRELIPLEHRACYTEKIAYLPDSYQPNDGRRLVPRPIARAELGLPEQAFVFCCFNNSYKITPAMFDSWMRILEQVPGSLLWLLEFNDTATANLRREARARGIAPERLRFALRAPMTEHLARQQAADLFLDTWPCNAHTTASDALSVGLPLLTLRGQAFASRVAASLLTAVGLPELITDSAPDYERRAVQLAADRAALAGMRERLTHRQALPLFDTARLARHIEAAYARMHERARRGAVPEDFEVFPITSG